MLGELAADAGEKLDRHADLNQRLDAAVTAVNSATTAMKQLVPREEMEARLQDLEREREVQRRKDRRTVLVVGVLVLAVTWAVIYSNRQSYSRQQQFLDVVSRRQEAVAICTRLNGDEAAIHQCVVDRVGALPEQ